MWLLFKLVSIVYFFSSSFVWWSFSLPTNLMLVFFNFIMLLCLMTSPFRLIITRKSIYVFIIIILLTLYSSFLINISVGMYIFFSYFPALLLYILPKIYKIDLLKFITKWYSIILGLSICVFFLTEVTSLPKFGSFHPENLDYNYYDNYIFFIKQRISNNFAYRFNGPFLEPGHQAMISGILLFANKYDFKRNKILCIPLLAILISFSLAGYVVLVLGLLLIFTKSIINLIWLGVIFISVNIFVSTIWNDGDNPVNMLIFKRLEYDDDKGISGNNRTVKQTDFFYNKSVENGSIITGVRSMKEDSKKIRGAGYKIFLLRYGVISLLFTLLLYVSLIGSKSNKRYSLSFLVLISMIFLQRAYPTWYSWLLPYTLAVNIILNRKHFLTKYR